VLILRKSDIGTTSTPEAEVQQQTSNIVGLKTEQWRHDLLQHIEDNFEIAGDSGTHIILQKKKRQETTPVASEPKLN